MMTVASLAMVACTPSAAPARPATSTPTTPARVEPAGPDVCASLCALGPSAATPQAPAVKTKLSWTSAGATTTVSDSEALVLFFWREPNGESIEGLDGLNDLAHKLAGLAGIRLAMVYVGDDEAKAVQARRELIDRDVSVGVIAGEQAQQLVAALAPDRLPVTYVLDRQHRPQARFDGAARWRPASVRAYFEGLVAGGGCGLSFEGSGAEGRCPAASP